VPHADDGLEAETSETQNIKKESIMRTFLLIILGLLLGLVIAPFLDSATAPTSTFSKKITVAKPAPAPVVAKGLCGHYGLDQILMELASGSAKSIKIQDLITLKRKGVTIRNGSKQTDLSKGIFRLNENQYAINFCGEYSELIKDFVETETPTGRCDHDGINDALLSVASGNKVSVSRIEMLTLKKELNVLQGKKATNLKEGIIQITESQYVINYCDYYFDKIKHYLPDDAEVPAHLSK